MNPPESAPAWQCFQAYFRTSRGGVGIPPASARAELERVLGPHHRLIQDVTPSRRLFSSALDESQLAARLRLLGYTRAIVRQLDVHPGQTAKGIRRREAGRWIELRPFVDNDEGPIPPPSIESGGDILSWPVGSPRPSVRPVDRRRRLSTWDARFIANILPLQSSARVLDPFAGLGVLVGAVRARGCWVAGVELDSAVANHTGLIRADARALPFAAQTFAAVVTEPPFRAFEHDDVVRSLLEIQRVLEPSAVWAVLATENLRVAIAAFWAKHDVMPLETWPVKRHGLATTLMVGQAPGPMRVSSASCKLGDAPARGPARLDP